jgi:hypothetical protein
MQSNVVLTVLIIIIFGEHIPMQSKVVLIIGQIGLSPRDAYNAQNRYCSRVFVLVATIRKLLLQGPVVQKSISLTL